jgi:hypothetical protein
MIFHVSVDKKFKLIAGKMRLNGVGKSGKNITESITGKDIRG